MKITQWERSWDPVTVQFDTYAEAKLFHFIIREMSVTTMYDYDEEEKFLMHQFIDTVGKYINEH